MIFYQQGQRAAFRKLGMNPVLSHALMGGALGAGTGYGLSGEGHGLRGALIGGAAGGALGAGSGVYGNHLRKADDAVLANAKGTMQKQLDSVKFNNGPSSAAKPSVIPPPPTAAAPAPAIKSMAPAAQAAAVVPNYDPKAYEDALMRHSGNIGKYFKDPDHPIARTFMDTSMTNDFDEIMGHMQAHGRAIQEHGDDATKQHWGQIVHPTRDDIANVWRTELGAGHENMDYNQLKNALIARAEREGKA